MLKSEHGPSRSQLPPGLPTGQTVTRGPFKITQSAPPAPAAAKAPDVAKAPYVPKVEQRGRFTVTIGGGAQKGATNSKSSKTKKGGKKNK